jgi:hypothetical protein
MIDARASEFVLLLKICPIRKNKREISSSHYTKSNRDVVWYEITTQECEKKLAEFRVKNLPGFVICDPIFVIVRIFTYKNNKKIERSSKKRKFCFRDVWRSSG